jgi:hypothetical protein
MVEPTENKNIERNEVNGAGIPAPTSLEAENAMKDFLHLISGLIEAFSNAFLDKEGQVKDLTDKEGREQDRQFMLGVQDKVEKLLANFGQAVKDFARRAAMPCEAELAEKDMKEIARMNNFFEKSFYYFVGWMLAASLVCCIGIAMISSASNKKSDLERWYRQQAEAITFGNYAIQNLPKSYKIWKEDFRQLTKQQQDSVMQQYQYR